MLALDFCKDISNVTVVKIPYFEDLFDILDYLDMEEILQQTLKKVKNELEVYKKLNVDMGHLEAPLNVIKRIYTFYDAFELKEEFGRFLVRKIVRNREYEGESLHKVINKLQLYEMYIASSIIERYDAEQVAGALKYRSIKRLRLLNCKINEESLCKLIESCSTITEVHLKANSLYSSHLKAIATSLVESQISVLDLGFNNFEGFDFSFINYMPSLQNINLEKTHIDRKELGTLNFRQLNTLSLKNNHIGTKSAGEIAQKLVGSNLKRLELGGNLIGKEGTIEIFKALHGTKLEYLGLSSNFIGNKGLKELSALSLTINKFRLKELDLSDNQIEFEGAFAFIKSFGWMLESVNLRFNKIEREFVLKNVKILT
jgi:hypothetical protein